MHGHTEVMNGGKLMRSKDSHFINMSYRKWIPRFLDLLDSCSIRATFFLVADFARDSDSCALIRRIVQGGHEIASHSLSHMIALRKADRKTLSSELNDSKKILEDISSTKVIGFRGPGYAFDTRIAEQLLECGYIYDSSVVPGYLFNLYKTFHFYADNILHGSSILFPNSSQKIKREPYIISERIGQTLLEIPINVLPIFPIPFVSFIIRNNIIFNSMYSLVKMHSPIIIYEFHDFEFMDTSKKEEYCSTKAVEKIRNKTITQRLDLYRSILLRISGECDMLTAKEYAESVDSTDIHMGEAFQ